MYPFSFTSDDKIKTPFEVVSLRTGGFSKLKMVLLHFLTFLKFKKKYNYSARKAYKVFTKYRPLVSKQYDVLHVHHIQLFSEGLLNCIEFYKIKTVLTLRGSDILIRPYRSKEELEFVKRVFRTIQYAHTVSDDLKTNLLQYDFPKKNIYPIKRTPEALTKIEKKQNDFFNITTIGRLHWTKGFVPALIVLSKIMKTTNKPVKFHICGSGSDEQVDEMKCWIRNLGLEDVVVLHGYLDNNQIEEVLSYTDLYIQPSVSEGVPNTLLRVLFNEILIIASKAGGIPEVITHGENGFLFGLNDFDKFHDLLKSAINGEIKRDGLVFDNKVFQNNLEVDSYKEMYLEIMNSK